MKKKTFIKIISLMREQYKLENEFADAVELIMDGRFVPQMSIPISEAFRLLLIEHKNEAFEDWVGWWLYECDGIRGNLKHDWFKKPDSESNKSDNRETIHLLCAYFGGYMWAPRTIEELWEMLEAYEG